MYRRREFLQRSVYYRSNVLTRTDFNLNSGSNFQTYRGLMSVIAAYIAGLATLFLYKCRRHRHLLLIGSVIMYIVSVYYCRFVSLAKDAPRVYSQDIKVILGVDRLDYTKGRPIKYYIVYKSPS
jgi:hypothetical protein